jgi:ABC-2 type transport system permease protein
MTAAARTAPGSLPGPVRRMIALARTETLLLTRNRTAVSMAVLMPFLMLIALRQGFKAQRGRLSGGDLHGVVLLGLFMTVLVFAVYYGLTAAYVARRNDLVLKRLRTGELSDLEILGGTALPAVLLALLQIVCATVGAALLFGLPAPEDPALVLLGLLLAVAVLVPLAALSSAFTRTVETSGITTLPVMLLTMGGSGLLVPFSVLPGPAATIARVLPTTPAMALLRIGWLGDDGGHHPVGWALYLAGAVAWAVVAIRAARRRFRWEPRH